MLTNENQIEIYQTAEDHPESLVSLYGLEKYSTIRKFRILHPSQSPMALVNKKSKARVK